jgi:hypothetical protein
MGRIFLIAPGFRLGNQAGKNINRPIGAAPFCPDGAVKTKPDFNPSLKPGAIDITFLRNGINTCTISRQIDVRQENSY